MKNWIFKKRYLAGTPKWPLYSGVITTCQYFNVRTYRNNNKTCPFLSSSFENLFKYFFNL